MINNTAYLKRIPWIVPLGLVYGISATFSQRWLFTQFAPDISTPHIITNIIYYALSYASLGIATQKWKELLFPAILDIALIFSSALLFTEGKGIIWILYFLILPIPLTIFISRQTGWQRKSVLIYFGILLAEVIFIQSFYVSELIGTNISLFNLDTDIWVLILQIISYFTVFV
jgi:hypothetical protein